MQITIDALTYQDLSCPLCGAVIKWSRIDTRDGGNQAQLHCQNGVMVGRRMAPDGTPDPTDPPCRWIGARATLFYQADGKPLFVPHMPVPLDEYPAETRARSAWRTS